MGVGAGACGGDELAGLLGGDFQQVGDVVVGLALITDRCRGERLLGAVCGDLFGGPLLHASDLLAQIIDLVVAGGFADGDGLPGGDVLVDRRGDELLALPSSLAAGSDSLT
ncbi:hypothetical protein [Nocardia sp. bgisy118]|uniref:hypothetical protein n=1 Tax=Nocardia sp. bgisy118 TaxID=3413786 RepID=UPI003F4A5810